MKHTRMFQELSRGSLVLKRSSSEFSGRLQGVSGYFKGDSWGLKGVSEESYRTIQGVSEGFKGFLVAFKSFTEECISGAFLQV